MMMMYDPARRQVVLFGGGDFYNYFNDTWTWDGSSWTRQHPGTSPRPMCCSGIAYDAATQQVVLFDGFLGETWTWDGVTWTQEFPSQSPVGRLFPGTASAGRHLLLTGGGSCLEDCDYDRDTWSWNGVTWVKRHPSIAPSARWTSATAYDPYSKQTVLFGGYNENTPPYLFDDTWVWDGIDWTREQPADRPSARERSGLAHDRTSRLLVMFGGDGAAGDLGDTWTWDGTNWTCVDGCT